MPSMCKIFSGRQEKYKALLELFYMENVFMFYSCKKISRIKSKKTTKLISCFKELESYSGDENTNDGLGELSDRSSGPPAMSGDCVDEYTVCRGCAFWGRIAASS